MNTFLKAELWLLMSFTVASSPLVVSGQAPVRAEEYRSPPPHLHANLWMQTSAEYEALCRQTFNAALREIKQAAKAATRHQGRPAGPDRKPLAVVADLDETILDNARFQSEMDIAIWADGMDIGYTAKRWEQWERENAEEVGLVPGAGPFISEVERLNIAMVYISNRVEDLKASTIQAMARNGINTQDMQQGTELRLLLRKGASNKQDRIKQVEERYHVIAYLGDNLGDFPGETKQPADVVEHLAVRRNKTEAAADLWGTRWFMLPNPVYGSWDQLLPTETAKRIQLLRRASNRGFVKAAN